jgi:hypothetical protein
MVARATSAAIVFISGDVAPSTVILDRPQIRFLLSEERSLVIRPRGAGTGRLPYAIGQRVPLHTRIGAPAIGRVRVVRIDDVALGELDDADAQLVGCRDLDELAAAWIDQHGRWDESARVWRVEVRPDLQERPRLLTSTAGRHGLRALQQYTSAPGAAMADEPEAVDDDTLAGFRRAAQRTEHDRFEQLLAQRRRLEPEERLRLVRADAARRRIDIDRTMRVVVRRLDALEEIVYSPVDRVRDAERTA